MVSDEFQRARSPEHKQRRAQDLYRAARELALRDGVGAVTLTAIAQEAGVHPSAMRRYYESREDILLRLAADGWQDWAAAVETELTLRGSVDATALTELFASSLRERPLFCDLLAYTPTSLERTSSLSAVRTYKVRSMSALTSVVAALHRYVPGLSQSAARDLIAATAAITAHFWQTAHPSPTLAALYREAPHLGHTVLDFNSRLNRVIGNLITGILTDQAGP